MTKTILSGLPVQTIAALGLLLSTTTTAQVLPYNHVATFAHLPKDAYTAPALQPFVTGPARIRGRAVKIYPKWRTFCIFSLAISVSEQPTPALCL